MMSIQFVGRLWCWRFFYPFFKRGITVAGCDYSESLVNIAKLHLPENNFAFCDANNINTDLKFNLVVSNSVFFYFPSYEYAEEVLKRMIHKSSKYIYVLEVSDMDYRDESIRLRKGYLTDKEYTKRYSNLNHLYYTKDWFVAIAKKYGVSDIRIEKQQIEDYPNNAYRFNVFMAK